MTVGADATRTVQAQSLPVAAVLVWKAEVPSIVHEVLLLLLLLLPQTLLIAPPPTLAVLRENCTPTPLTVPPSLKMAHQAFGEINQAFSELS